MPDDLLPNENPVPAPSSVPTPGRRLRCEFCECPLAPNGDYMALSDKAKDLRRQSETIDKLKDTIAKLEAACADALAARDEARALVKPDHSGITW